MRRNARGLVRFGLLALGAVLGLLAVTTLLSGLSVLANTGEVDLAIRGMAPEQVDIGSTYVVNVSYANVGTMAAPVNSVLVT